MLRTLTIAVTAVAALAFAANLQAQGPGRGGRGMGGPGGGMAIMYLQNEQVQKELDLDADQKEKIQKMATEMRDSRGNRGDNANLSQEERRAKAEERAAKVKKELDGILTPKQTERLKQIGLQAQGARALTNPEVVKELGITEDQQAKMKTIGEEARKDMPQMTPNTRPSEEDMAKMRKAFEETGKKMMDVLTAEQKEKFTKMQGEKFDTSSLMRGFGGGRRGGNRGNGGSNGGQVN